MGEIVKISQKKNCNGCRALSTTGRFGIHCELGYDIKKGVLLVGGFHFSKVEKILEPCPKPMNYTDFIYAMDHFRKKS